MNATYFLVTLGPVQEFIAQARRTRDLWFGSHLLGELSRAAARAVADAGGELIFPALEKGHPELEPADGPFRPGGAPALSIANRIVAVLPDGCDPSALAKECRKAVTKRLEDVAARVEKRCADLLAPESAEIWREQLDTLVEFLAAWAPVGDAPDGYRQAREHVERRLAGRKGLRDFASWSRQGAGRLKSSLDGGRSTVLEKPDQRPAELVRRFRINAGEQLDAIGLLKRAGGEPEHFVPLANVALGPWISKAAEAAPAAFQAVRTACGGGVFTQIGSALAAVKAFPFDAQVFLPDRWKSLLSEIGLPREWGETHVQPLLAMMKTPSPYLACLVADGDKMGAAISELSDPERHRDLSRQLALFATKAREIVAEWDGILVYAGGDDVLAFLPLHSAAPCAERLHKAFAEMMAPLGLSRAPTLSVGLGIGHLLVPMGELLALGRRAERLAKDSGRNRLAVVADKRSGGEVQWSRGWHDDPSGLLAAAKTALAGDLSHKKVYEIARAISRMPEPAELSSGNEASWCDVLLGETRRILARTEARGVLEPAQVGLDLSGASYSEYRQRIDDWVSLMMIARLIAHAEASAEPRAGSEKELVDA
ncbi:MAG: type III-B CRISPR-associated protein Cas10/Cmr2 [Candidatus Sericytochromatia bacterium]|nr:type III-B CRISPR-associated protein Cas10/Cmr2 [Candidatus Tanganyikabacteria bacterium]